MPRMSIFNSPFLLGFEQLEQVMDSVSKHSGDGYPPYNIEQIGDNAIRISLAVAGFFKEDLSVSVEQNRLIVRGQQVDDESDTRDYLHRGIAARQFARQFVLADGMKVSDAFMKNGLLHIDLVQPEPETKAIEINIR